MLDGSRKKTFKRERKKRTFIKREQKQKEHLCFIKKQNNKQIIRLSSFCIKLIDSIIIKS